MTSFLSVIAAGAGNQDPALNLALNQEILQVYANKVAVNGEKSLELVMSILISTLWYCKYRNISTVDRRSWLTMFPDPPDKQVYQLSPSLSLSHC